MFLVRELSRRSGSTEETTGHATAVISNQITIISSEVSASLSISSFPIYKGSEMEVNRETLEEDAVSAIYRTDNGSEICKGRKTAITAMIMTFESSDEAQVVENTILEGQKLALKDADTTEAQQTVSEEVQPEPRRSIAIVNLWSPPGSPSIHTGEKSQNPPDDGSETQEMSPLRHRSQNLSQPGRSEQQDGRNGKAGDTDTTSEIFDTAEPLDQVLLSVRLRSSQEANANQNQSKAFHARVDDAVAKQKSLPSAKAIANARSPAKEGRTKTAPHLPLPKVDRNAKSQSPAKTSSSKLKKRSLQKDDTRQAMSQTKALVGTVATEPEPPSSPVSAAQKVKNASATKPLLPVRPSTSATKLKKPLGGPMARLAGSQPQGNQLASKTDSQSKLGSKRKVAPSKKAKSDENVDWDEGLQDESQYDLPEDPIDDERPTKKAKKAAKQPGPKTASKPSTTKAKVTSTLKKPAPKARKTKEEKSAVETPKPTVASTRTRRAAANPTTYEEDSGSDAVEAGNQTSPASPERSILRPTRPITGSKAKPAGAKVQKESDHTQVVHSDVHATHKANTSADRLASPQQDDGFNIEPEVDHEEIPAEVSNADLRPVVFTEEVNDDAQDSYPMDKASRDAAVAKADTSFDTQLQTQLKATKAKNMANKENMAPQTKTPKTPLGNAEQFIANVNAAKSSSPKKAAVPSRSKPEAKFEPREMAKVSVSSIKQGVTSAPATVIEPKLQSTKPQELRGEAVLSEEAREPLQDELDDMGIGEDIPTSGMPDVALVTRKTTSNPIDTSEHVGKVVSLISKQATLPATLTATGASDPDSASKPEQPLRSSPAAGSSVIRRSEQPEAKSKASGRNERAHAIDQPAHQGGEASQGTPAAALVRVAKRPTEAKVSSSKQTRNAPSPAKNPNVAGKNKAPASRASDAASVAPRTPGRGLLPVDDSLTSDKAAKRTSIIVFGKDGPKNQGVRNHGSELDASEAQTAPPETIKHTKAKAQHDQIPNITTPSRDPDGSSARPVSISDDGHTDSADEGMNIQLDAEIEAEMQPVIENDVPESMELSPEAEPKTNAPSPHQTDALPSPDAEGPPEESLQSVDRDDDSVDGDSSAEMEGLDDSEYQEPTELIDYSQEFEDNEPVIPKPRSNVPVPPFLRQKDHVATLQPALSNALATEPADTKRQSIGLRALVGNLHKGATKDIATNSFRQNQHPATNDSAVNIDAITREEPARPKPSQHLVCAVQDRTNMPPPPTRRVGTEQMSALGSNINQAPVKAGFTSQNFEARDSNPVAATRPAPSLPEIEEPKEVLQDPEPRRKSRASAVRISREIVENGTDLEPSSGTPIPYHSKLAETVNELDGASHRKAGSYFSDSTGTTLLNRSSLSGFAPPQPMRLDFQRGMTETTDDSMSQAWDSESAWRNVRPSYRSFAQYMAHIADVSFSKVIFPAEAD